VEKGTGQFRTQIAGGIGSMIAFVEKD